MSVHLQEFFNLCDPDGKQAVDRDAFRQLCNKFNIASRDADMIFEDLDHDNDGIISFEDFSRGFSDFLASPEVDCDVPQKENVYDFSKEEHTKHNVWSMLTCEAERYENNTEGKDNIKHVLQELQTTDKRHLVPYLENAVDGLLENLQHLQDEKIRLEEGWRKEKQEHERHLRRMEEEMDSQVKDTENRLRLKAQAEFEDGRRSLQSKMDAEMDNIQAHLALFEKVSNWLQSQPSDSYDVRLEEVRNKLEDAVLENRQLRMSLLDTQTSIALMRSELRQLRSLYEEKCREVSSEREKIMEVLIEQDHLTRQLNLLHDVNRMLQDTNDALRSNAEPSVACSKRFGDQCMSRWRSGSILGDYFESTETTCTAAKYPEHDIIEDVKDDVCTKQNLRKARSMDIYLSPGKKERSAPKKANRVSQNLSDSGISTQEQEDMSNSTPDSSLVQEVEKVPRCHPETTEHSQSTKFSNHLPQTNTNYAERRVSQDKSTSNDFLDHTKCEKMENKEIIKSDSPLPSEMDDMPKKKISEIIKQLGMDESPNTKISPKRSSTKADTTTEIKSSTRAPIPMPRKTLMNRASITKEFKVKDNCSNLPYKNGHLSEEVKKQHCASDIDEVARSVAEKVRSLKRGTSISQLIALENSGIFESDGPAEQTFKIIFIGDAGVGKSSFALRISKGVFIRHTSSTVGMDFFTRIMKVDGRNIALQLWDTAGQERYRSITQSYFRNADGVMLLYDCTCERSFLNVRQWIEDVNKVASARLPLMIVANKVDLRESYRKAGHRVITTEEGERLAKTCDTTFMEASAKNGLNVLPALAKLVRSMSTHQELRATSSSVQLMSETKKNSGCCGR